MPYADEFDVAAAINNMANTLDQGANNVSAGIDWGMGPEGSAGTHRDASMIGEDIREQSPGTLDQTMLQKPGGPYPPAAAGPMNWGQGPEGSEGTPDLGQNPSLQALQAALGIENTGDQAWGEQEHTDFAFELEEDSSTGAAQAGTDLNAFLSAVGGRNIGGQKEIEATRGNDTRGDNPIDIIRSNYPWARSLPNNVLSNAARNPDYLRLLIEHDAAGKELPLVMPTSTMPEGSG